MRFEERLQVPVSVDEAWAFLWQTERLAACLPGCTEAVAVSPGERYTAPFEDRIGPYRATFERRCGPAVCETIMLSPFRLLTPSSAREATEALRDLGEQAKIYAGGAELLLLLRHRILEADYLVDIKHIPGLDRLAWDGRTVRIGATVVHHRLETDPL